MKNRSSVMTGGNGVRKREEHDFYATPTKRVAPMLNGEPLDEKGKPWSSAMCFCWFVWEVGYQGEPVVRFLRS